MSEVVCKGCRALRTNCGKCSRCYEEAQSELSALREELARVTAQSEQRLDAWIKCGDLRDATEQRNVTLGDALLKIIEMNRQHAEDQYGDPDKAESWACIRVAREAMEAKNEAS